MFFLVFYNICKSFSLICRVLNESPRWLLERGQLEESVRVLRRAAKLNRTVNKLPVDLEDKLVSYFSYFRILFINKSTLLHSGLLISKEMTIIVSFRQHEFLINSSSVTTFDDVSLRSRLASLFSSKPMIQLTSITIIFGIVTGANYVIVPLRSDFFQ